MTLTEDVSDNDSINLLVNNLVNNATFSQHALNDYATKSNSLARRDGRCFSAKEVVHYPIGGMLVTSDFC